MQGLSMELVGDVCGPWGLPGVVSWVLFIRARMVAMWCGVHVQTVENRHAPCLGLCPCTGLALGPGIF